MLERLEFFLVMFKVLVETSFNYIYGVSKLTIHTRYKRNSQPRAYEYSELSLINTLNIECLNNYWK